MPEPTNGVRWRLESLERRVNDLEKNLNTMLGTLARIEERAGSLKNEVESVHRDVNGMRRALYTFGFGFLLVAATGIGSIAVLLAQ